MFTKPKVLLIYPSELSFWGFTYPLGLLYVAHSLIKQNIDVSILNLSVESIRNLKKDDYLFVGITMLTGKMISTGLRIAKLIKEYDSGIPIVLGGVHPSVLPEQSLQNEYIDIVVIGEGEETVKDLADTLLNKKDLSCVKGIAYKNKEGNTVINPSRDYIDMDTLDIDLPYHLLGTKFLKSSVLPVHTSRGCPYRCSFCYSTYFNKRKYRTKSSERVAEEIEFLYKNYNIRNFNFDYEDEFFIDPARVLSIFESVKRKGLNIRWTSFCRFDSFDKAYAKYGEAFPKLLKESGCYYMGFGAESGSQRMLNEVIKKDITVEQIVRTTGVLSKYGIAHRLVFINCFPTETTEDINATCKLINELSENNKYIFIGIVNLMPLPGTPIFDLLTNNYNYKIPTSLEEWGNYKLPVDLKNITWVPKEHALMCCNLLKLSPGVFYRDLSSYQDFKELNDNTGLPYAHSYISYLLSKIARWRYKNQYFKFMIEIDFITKMYGFYYRYRAYIVNSIFKKYLSVKLYKILKNRFGDKSWKINKLNQGGAPPDIAERE
ncbi:MAG: radical SAM protein [Elusimicrobiota bacterium]